MDIENRLIEYFNNTNTKVTVEQLVTILNVSDIKELVSAINKLEDNCIIHITKKGFIVNASSLNLYKAKITLIKKYFAICELDNGKEYKIYNECLDNAYLNDIVKIHVLDESKAEVVSIIKRNMWQLTATYYNGKLEIENKNFPYSLKVSNLKDFKCVNDDVLFLKVIKYDGFVLHCKIDSIIGNNNEPGVDVLKIVYNSGVKYKFDGDVIKETYDVIDENERNLDLTNRKDLTDKLIVTIDGLDAKDLDDAISLEVNENGNYVLGVHIADVSNFVKENSLLDKEAFTRGTSIYLADRVIPMLPFSLCNGICSLNENELRLTISCIMEIDPTGEVINYEITPSYIKSKARLDYDDVNLLFKNKDTRLTYSKELKKMLYDMRVLSSILRNKMISKGYVNLSVPESSFEFDDKGNVIDVKIRKQDEAERLIENFMIVANETVASAIYYMQLPFIYRVHPSMDKKRLANLFTYLKDNNIPFKGNINNVSVFSIQDLLNKVKGTSYEFVTNNMVLRSMSKAYYDVTNIGHFGLGSSCYTHFTSPIRRYPDLVVHRFLKKYLVENNFEDKMEFLIQASNNSSVTERNAISLEREVSDIKKACYIENYVGNIYKGVVVSILEFGMFIMLDNSIEGLLRYEYLDKYYTYEQICQKFKLGDIINVQVISVNKQQGEINFAFISKVKNETNKH